MGKICYTCNTYLRSDNYGTYEMCKNCCSETKNSSLIKETIKASQLFTYVFDIRHICKFSIFGKGGTGSLKLKYGIDKDGEFYGEEVIDIKDNTFYKTIESFAPYVQFHFENTTDNEIEFELYLTLKE